MEGGSLTPNEIASIRELVNHILESDAFRGSERCKQFLGFVIERTLEGRQAEIKERTIGTEVFGRPADYEPVGDSIVRVKANEVRRRLARYYAEFDAQPIRIDLPPGSYVPVIHRVAPASQASGVPAGLVMTSARPAAGKRRRTLWMGAVALAAATLLAAAFLGKWRSRGAMEDFWAPVTRSADAPILRLPEYQVYMFSRRGGEILDGSASDATSIPLGPAEYRKVLGFHVSVPTFHAAMDLALFLQRHGRIPVFRVGADLPASELRSHPVIAISSRPSEWAMTEAPAMRFRFRPIEARTRLAYMIEDRSHPEAGWRVDQVFPFEDQTMDYALVSRIFDPSTRNVALSVSGLTSFGGQAAAAFLTNPDGWRQVVAKAPHDWADKNLQVVLQTALVGRTPSPAKVVAVHCW